MFVKILVPNEKSTMYTLAYVGTKEGADKLLALVDAPGRYLVAPATEADRVQFSRQVRDLAIRSLTARVAVHGTEQELQKLLSGLENGLRARMALYAEAARENGYQSNRKWDPVAWAVIRSVRDGFEKRLLG